MAKFPKRGVASRRHADHLNDCQSRYHQESPYCRNAHWSPHVVPPHQRDTRDRPGVVHVPG
ncbi:hypothetical protein G9C98_008447 [Cotesia typhae]|uniref:Uncharacterized protein n=1 Tax=Cotesia typhae TaxID=2053667 RepID=A0A8J5QXQ0_9HYME|nr:hypothetical protein G9C98_008447 [Cotesia typhae]